jgi:beta-N-acetylhexosaminidase
MRRTASALLALLALSTMTGSTLAAGGTGRGTSPGGGSAAADTPTMAQLVGQKLVVAMAGTVPSEDLLGRVGRGEIGGVVLFGTNVGGPATLRALTTSLQEAATAGGQPPLLISTDQEGGTTQRIAWAPPTLSPPRMGALGSTTTARSQGAATGYALRCAGINTDLAPVADVPASSASFMAQQGRTWSSSASLTATLSDAFATGLAFRGSIPVMKHFPGIGYATRNTDSSVVTITASRTQLAPGLRPYATAIADGLPVVMLSNATYPAYDAANAAGWSTAIGTDLLRGSLGFRGVTITDSLSGTAKARGVTATSLPIRAAKAGTDMLMLTGSEAATRATFTSLLAAAESGAIPLAILQASYDRIVALKATVAGPVEDTTPPAVHAPISRLVAPSTLGPGTVAVSTAWTASDPCRVGGTWLERSAKDGPWAFQPLASSLSTSIRQSLGLRSTYRYAARATDGAGNRGAWTFAPEFRPMLVDQASAAVRYAGRWATVSSTAYSGGSIRRSTTAGASASYTFTGTDVAWVAATGPTRGSAAVYVDGVRHATVNLHAAAVHLRRIVYAAHWGSQETHTIRVVVLGTAGHPRVDVDGFVRLERA